MAYKKSTNKARTWLKKGTGDHSLRAFTKKWPQRDQITHLESWIV